MIDPVWKMSLLSARLHVRKGRAAVNDSEIRRAYHRIRLARHHRDPNTLVIDELGLRHGASRADIAVVNGHLVGIEIKSDVDTLSRLDGQVDSYSAVFDRAVLVTTARHSSEALESVPGWWGVVEAHQGPRGAVRFQTLQPARSNPAIDPHAVAQLLWRDEAVSLLEGLGAPSKVLRQRRSALYEELVGRLGRRDLQMQVREALKSRSSWRESERPS